MPRDGLWRAQTPQGFRFDAILAAHRPTPARRPTTSRSRTPPALRCGWFPAIEANFKITTAADLARARASEGAMDIRTGNGFDVHAFGPGDGVTLCGVAIPFDRGLVGHSDADVGLHALTDAVLGALGEGDIGQWFPPSDPTWKGAASTIFLAGRAERAAERGFAISHLDVTLICEAPKVGPHAAAMRARSPAPPASTPSGSASRRRPRNGSASPAAARASPPSPPRRWCGHDVVPLTRAIATFGYVGFVPVAAGTAGSLAALSPATCCTALGGFPLLAAATVAAYCIGYWATHVETHQTDDLDPGHIVIDEVVGMWIALMPLSFGLWHAGAAPGLFSLAGLGRGLPPVPALRHLEALAGQLGRPPQGADRRHARRRPRRG